MKPRFGIGRREGSRSSSSSDLSAEELVDIEVVTETVLEDEPREGPSAVQSTAPIRPDLGPPAPGPQSGNQPGAGLGLIVSIAVTAIVFVLAIYATGSQTANPLPLAQTTNALYWIVGAVATAGAGAGALYADRTAARARNRELGDEVRVSTAWIVPSIATATALLLVATFHNTSMIVIGPLIAFVGNAGALLSRDLLDDADEPAQRTATTVQAVVIHAVAFFALSAIYLNKLPTPITALLVGIVVTLMAIEALERRPVLDSRRVLLALLAGGAVAASSAPLMWWPTYSWTGGAVLFVVFYCAIGSIQTAVERHEFGPRDAILYGLLPLGAFLLLAITA